MKFYKLFSEAIKNDNNLIVLEYPNLIRFRRFDIVFCPITITALKKLDKFFYTHDVEKAVKILDLPEEDAEKIIGASDGYNCDISIKIKLLEIINNDSRSIL